jgi:hypothetical protein
MNQHEEEAARAARQAAFSARESLNTRGSQVGSGISIAEARRIRAEAEERQPAPSPERRGENHPLEIAAREARQAAFRENVLERSFQSGISSPS